MFDFLRERTKSSTEITQEALNAYLDNALAAAERQRLEQQLGQDARLRAELQQLRVLKQQLAQMPRRRVPRNFTLDPAVYGRPQRQPLLQLYPVLQGATALAALVFILVLGLGFFQGQFGGGQPQTAAVEVTRVVTEVMTEEQAVAEEPAELPAEEPVAEAPAAAESSAMETAVEAPVEEAEEAAPAAEADLAMQVSPPSGTLESGAATIEVQTDTQEALPLGAEATVVAADETSAAREGEVAATDEAIADSEPFEFDTESVEVANQPAGEVAGSNLINWQIALGVLLLVLVVLLLLARRRLRRL
jgi:anti-sigma factor RsiW